MRSARSRRPARSALALGLLAGAALDRVVGDPRRGHPVAGFGRLAAALERRVWRPSRLAGAGYALGLVGVAATGAGLVDARVRAHPAVRALLVGTVTWTALGGRSLGRVALELAAAVRAGDLEAARRLAPALVGRDASNLDGPELCRAAVESVAENTADAVVGPLLWGALAGPSGVAAYRTANTLDAMVGHRSLGRPAPGRRRAPEPQRGPAGGRLRRRARRAARRHQPLRRAGGAAAMARRRPAARPGRRRP